jgi:hypothetical protein
MIYLSPLGQDVRLDVDVKSQDKPSMQMVEILQIK